MTSGSAARLKRVAPRHEKAECSSTTTSPLRDQRVQALVINIEQERIGALELLKESDTNGRHNAVRLDFAALVSRSLRIR